MAKLFLVPNLLSNGEWQHVLPHPVYSILTDTRFFIVENIRTTRRFMKQVNRQIDINSLTFFELNKHTHSRDIPAFLIPLEEGHNVAVVSEAGCPGVADPGAEVVKIAHQKGFQVIPLIGPSSIILSLMASGLNGQNFTFHGYLPVNASERVRMFKLLEKKVKNQNQTQIFIETPYRNNQLVADLLKHCLGSTLLCIATNITGENEFIATQTIDQWKKDVPDLHKQPTTFLIGR